MLIKGAIRNQRDETRLDHVQPTTITPLSPKLIIRDTYTILRRHGCEKLLDRGTGKDSKSLKDINNMKAKMLPRLEPHIIDSCHETAFGNRNHRRFETQLKHHMHSPATAFAITRAGPVQRLVRKPA